MGLFKGGWKFVGGFLAIIAIALAGLAVSGYFFNPERQAERDLKELERQYAEDTYGGTTPEETLGLFIKALESGDIELASKYFVVEEREKWKSKIKNVVDGNKLSDMLNDLNREKHKYSVSDGMVGFDIANDNNEVALTILLGRGPNNIWKIVDM